MILWMFIVGLVAVIASVAALLFCIFTTPTNLRGFYGFKYSILVALAIAVGVALIVASFIVG